MNKKAIQTPTSIAPSEADVILAYQTSRRLNQILDDRKEYRLQLVHDDKPDDVVKIPASAMQLLVKMLSEMGQGHAVALTPIESEITTQQAADILNVSRPFLVQLLEKGEIPFRKVGTRRRIQTEDVLAYKQEMYEKRHQALAELTAYDQELGLQ